MPSAWPFSIPSRDDFGDIVFRLVLAPCRFDAELAHEAQAVEFGELGVARRLRRFADVLRFDASGALEDRAQAALGDVGGFLVSVSRSGQNHVFPELALGIFALDDNEFRVDHFRLTILRTFQKSTLADIAGADIHLDDDDRAVGNDVETFLSSSLIEIHDPILSLLRLRSTLRLGTAVEAKPPSGAS